MLPSVRASGALAFGRPTAVLAAPDASGHRLSPSPALPETRLCGALPRITCLSLPRSAETGRRAGRAVTRGRPGEPHLLPLLGPPRNVPFDEQALTDAMYLHRGRLSLHVSVTGTPLPCPFHGRVAAP